MNEPWLAAEQAIEAAKGWAAGLPDICRKLVAWSVPEHGLQRLDDRLTRLRSLPSCFDRPLRIAFCGESRAGKSTLINALVGEPIATTDVLECTFAPMVFRYGGRRAARVELIAGQTRDVAIDALARELEEIQKSGRSDDVVRIVVELPLDALRDYEVADVPGVGASQRNARVARSFTETTDAVVFVLNATLLGQSELAQEIRSLAQEFPEVCLVVNKVDLVGLDNAERAVAFVRDQDYGRPLRVLPMCAAAVHYAKSTSSTADQWMRDLISKFLEPLRQNASIIQAVTALNKCQRDLAISGALLQTAYHHGMRSQTLVGLADEAIRDTAPQAAIHIEEKINRWLQREAFAAGAARLRENIQELGVPSRPALEALIANVLTDEAMERESQAFAQQINQAVTEGWQAIAAKIEERCYGNYTPCQLEAALQVLRKGEHVAAPSAALSLSQADLLAQIGQSSQRIVTDDERHLAGTLSGGDIGGSMATGILAGTAATTLLAWLGSATAISAATGVGLPLAAVTASGALLARYLTRKRNQPAQASLVELAEMVEDLRSHAAQRLADAYFPEGVAKGVQQKIATDAERCTAHLHGSLWDRDAKAEDLQLVAEATANAERLGQNVSQARRLFCVPAKDDGTEPAGVPSLAFARAFALFEKPRRYGTDSKERLRADLASVLGLEDTQLTVADRALTGDDLEWLRDCLPQPTFLRTLIYDAERDTQTLAEFAHALQRIRTHERGETSVRVVKYPGQDRTPLDRYLLIGTDWVLELTAPLSRMGQREITVTLLEASADRAARDTYLENLGSFDLVRGDWWVAEIQVFDL